MCETEKERAREKKRRDGKKAPRATPRITIPRDFSQRKAEHYSVVWVLGSTDRCVLTEDENK